MHIFWIGIRHNVLRDKESAAFFLQVMGLQLCPFVYIIVGVMFVNLDFLFVFVGVSRPGGPQADE
jgi:hypothetical protein